MSNINLIKLVTLIPIFTSCLLISYLNSLLSDNWILPPYELSLKFEYSSTDAELIFIRIENSFSVKVILNLKLTFL